MKPKRFKVQCCECNAVFNNDYRKTHEEVNNGKRVAIKMVGAPANPFEAASLLKKRKSDSLTDVGKTEPRQKRHQKFIRERKPKAHKTIY